MTDQSWMRVIENGEERGGGEGTSTNRANQSRAKTLVPNRISQSASVNSAALTRLIAFCMWYIQSEISSKEYPWNPF